MNPSAIVAQILLQATSQPGGPPPPDIGNLFRSPMFLILLMFVVFYAVIIRGNRREKRKKEDMLNNVARNDRVLTIGGIIGTVVQVKDDELVIKIDESTNTKMNIIRSAVRQVLPRDEKPGDAARTPS